MLEYKNITIEDYKIFKKYIYNENELSCENSFANLFLWHGDKPNSYAVVSNTLIVKTQDKDRVLYRLPQGENFELAMAELREDFNGKLPDFYAYDGKAFSDFINLFGEEYEIRESRDDFEYIYKCEDLINLSGKKYHSKRNHISAFSKNYDWHYERISNKNIEQINECARAWYKLNREKSDNTLSIDKDESRLLISNMDELELVGGAIFIGEKAVAYTIGTPLNNRAFDIMVEKALPEFATAYSVINREFAKNELSGFEYINREDDMGIEGLRKAKLSYKPQILLKKYYCAYKGKDNV